MSSDHSMALHQETFVILQFFYYFSTISAIFYYLLLFVTIFYYFKYLKIVEKQWQLTISNSRKQWQIVIYSRNSSKIVRKQSKIAKNLFPDIRSMPAIVNTFTTLVCLYSMTIIRDIIPLLSGISTFDLEYPSLVISTSLEV